jgi:nucleoside phosphorylase
VEAKMTRNAVDFLLLTALEEELRCLLDCLPGYRKEDPAHDDTHTYYKASIEATLPSEATTTYSAIASAIMEMGRVEAAAITALAIQRWHPRFVILIGIAGGVSESGPSLGDILISDQVVDYELQKLKIPHDQIRYEVHRADPRLLGAAMNFTDTSWTECSTPRPGPGTSRRWIGPIATGDKVVARQELIDKYRQDWPKLIGVEMEAGGVATAAYRAASKPGFFMIRGVSDLANEKKDTKEVELWREYACSIAASYAVALLRSGPVPPIEETAPLDHNLEHAIKHTLNVNLSTEEVRKTIETDLRESTTEGIFGDGGLCVQYPRKPRPNNCFVAAGIGSSTDLTEALSSALLGFEVTPIKPDDLVVSGALLCKIASLIRETRFGVYELTANQDHNVYLQLGIAIGLQRPFLLLKHRDAAPSPLANSLDYYPVDSYLELRFGLQHKVRDVVLSMAHYEICLGDTSKFKGRVFVEHGDADRADFIYTVAKSLNSAGARPLFRRLDELVMKILESEKLDFDLFDQTAANPLQQTLAAVSASQLSIIRIGEDTSPDAALTLGVALAKNRRAILMHTSGVSIPSTLLGLNCITFDSFSELSTKLNFAIKNFLK